MLRRYRLVWWIPAVIGFAVLCGCSRSSKTSSPATIQPASGAVEQDYGDILVPSAGREFTHDFTFPPAELPAEVKLVQKSCNCVGIKVRPVSDDWKKGAVISISGRWRSARAPQRFEATFSREQASRVPETQRFVIVANCYPQVESVPSQIDFGEVSPSDGGVARVLIDQYVDDTNIDRPALSVTAMSESLSIVSKQSEHQQAGNRIHRYRTAFDLALLDRKSGARPSAAGVELSSISISDSANNVSVPVVWRYRHYVKARPASIFVRDPRHEKITIRLIGSSPFTLDSVKTSSGIEVLHSESFALPEKEHSVQLTATTSDFESLCTEIHITVTVSSIGSQIVKIPVTLLSSTTDAE